MMMNSLTKVVARRSATTTIATTSGNAMMQRRTFLMPSDSWLWLAYKPKDRADSPPPGVDPLYWQNRLGMRIVGPQYHGPIGSVRHLFKQASSGVAPGVFIGTWSLVAAWVMYKLLTEDMESWKNKQIDSHLYNQASQKEAMRRRILKNRGGHGHDASWGAH